MEQRHTILIVDDDSAVIRSLVVNLEREGYNCVTAASGEDAVRLFDASPTDLALVDVRLPGMDGVEVVAALKRRGGAYLPVALITGADNVEDRVRGFRAGCDDFLTKPVDGSELVVRVGALLQRRRQHSQLVTAHQRLLEAQQRKQMLASLIVHDVRNPLAALQGNIELLGEELGSDNALVGEILADCRDLASKALSLVAGLLDIEELEEGRLKPSSCTVDMAEFFARAIASHRTAIHTRALRLEVSVTPGLTGYLDPRLMERLVDNLVDNAVRHASLRGRVVVSAARRDDELVLCIGNDGTPIPVAEREKIFGRYYRLEGRHAKSGSGRGLGLYLCKLVAEAHGGSIEAEEKEGLGPCFVLRIPQPAQGLPEAEPDAPRPARDPLG